MSILKLGGVQKKLRVLSLAAKRRRQSRCLSLKHRDPRIALQTEGDALGIFRVDEERNNFLTELPRWERRTEAGQKLLGFDAYGARIGVGAGVTDSGATDDLQRR